jgi:hypothetical protein
MHRYIRSVARAAVLVALFVTVAIAAEVPAPLVDAYVKVQTDLAADDLTKAVADAKVVSGEAAKAGADAAKVRAAADKLASATAIEPARTAFGDLSEALIQLAGGKAPSGDVKIAYCPMVKKPWLQKGEKIQNPYFGKQMIGCGEIKK